MPTRNARATWNGGLKSGNGKYEIPNGPTGEYTFSSRFESAAGSNPEELLAAAEAACFSMALALGLENAGKEPQRIETQAACTVEKVADGFQITKIKLVTRATVPDLDRDEFKDIAEAAKGGCPVSKALMGNVDIQLD